MGKGSGGDGSADARPVVSATEARGGGGEDGGRSDEAGPTSGPAEAKVTVAELARELEICYQVVAIPVDYPAEKEGEVSHAQTLRIMGESMEKVARLFTEVVEKLRGERLCPCSQALDGAVG